MRFRLVLTESIIAVAVAALCTFIAMQTLGYSDVSLSIPTTYGGDGTFYGMMIKGVMDSGWYMENPWLGAPFGLEMGAFPMVDDTHFAMIKLIGSVTGDFGLTLSLFAFASYATAAISAYVVMRLLGLTRMYSGAGAFLFSMQSYHFLRGGHLFLASYFSVPIFVGIAIALYRQPAERLPGWGILTGIAALLFIASGTGIYYTFFGSLLIGFAAFAASIEQRHWRPILLGTTAGAIVLLSVFANLAPHFTSIAQHLDDHAITDRTPSDSEIYGLRLIQMALPSAGHRRFELRKMADNYKGSS